MLKYFLMNMISVVILILLILLGVAFLTLMERKILGYIQMRKGPNKLGIMGLLQPFSDAIKLMTKEVFILKSNYFYYYFSPMLSIFLSMFFWLLYPFFFNLFNYHFSILFMFCLFSLGPYSLMLGGWSSNSNYSMLGALRTIAQSISYEVSMILIILNLIFLVENFLVIKFFIYQKFIWFMIILFPLMLMFFISVLAELNRTPFDLIEGESELVSGFNVEYFSSLFVLYFLAEYMMIIFSMMILIILFLGVLIYSWGFFLLINMFLFLVIWVRGILPRIRYDELMYLCWKKILPLTMMYLIFVFNLKIIINNDYLIF